MCLYNIDDLVFAKVKGYSPWPAKIIGLESGSYRVFFFGTRQEATVKEQFICNYRENKNKFATKYKNKPFKKAMEIIKEMEPQEDLEEADEENRRFQMNPFYITVEHHQQDGMHRQHRVAGQRNMGTDEVEKLQQQGVDDVRERQQQREGNVEERQQQGEGNVGEGQRQGVGDVGEGQQQGVDVAGERAQQGVAEHQQLGVGEVANVPRANARVADKIKLKVTVELEMSEDQLISVGQKLPVLLKAANVQT